MLKKLLKTFVAMLAIATATGPAMGKAPVCMSDKAEPHLAWQNVPDGGLTACMGFENIVVLPVIGMDDDFAVAHASDVRFGTTNPEVLTLDGMYGFTLHGAGSCAVYAVFDGDDDYLDDSVAYTVTVVIPDTITTSLNVGGSLQLGTVARTIGMGQYIVVPGSELVATATPDAMHYLIGFDNDEPVNSNIAQQKTYIINGNTSIAVRFAAKPILTLAQNDAMGDMSVAINTSNITVFEEDFDSWSALDGHGWSFVDNDGDAVNWKLAVDGQAQDYDYTTLVGLSDPVRLYSESYSNIDASTYDADNWAVTPAITLGDASKLSYYVGLGDVDYHDKLGVYIGTTADISAMTALVEPTAVIVDNINQMEERVVDLSDYDGQTVYIAFRHQEDDGFFLFIDDIKVTSAEYTILPSSADSTYVLDYGTVAIITASADAQYYVFGWQNESDAAYAEGVTYSDYAITDPANYLPATSTLTLTVTSDTTTMALFYEHSYDVAATVALTEDVRGTVSISYTDIYDETHTDVDAADGSISAKGGTTTTLVATPAAGYQFVNWTDGVTVLGTSETLDVTEATTVTANFDTARAELAWSSDAFTGYSMIDFNNWAPTLTNPHNVEVRYGCVEGLIPSEGGITVDPETGIIGTALSYGNIMMLTGTFHIYAVHDMTQEYFYDSVVYTLTVENGVTVILTKNIETAGTVRYVDYGSEATLTHHYADENGIAFVAHDNNVAVEAAPATGYHFVDWATGDLVNGYTPIATTAQYTATMPDTDIYALRADFDTNIYNVTATSFNEELGTVTGGGQVKHFRSTELVATAKHGYHFVAWINENGDEVSTASSLNVIPVGDTSLTAVFDTNIYTVVWSGDTTVTYSSHPYTGIKATYTDFMGVEHTPELTFVCGDETITTPDYPETVGTWTVSVTVPDGDSLLTPVTTFVIARATIYVSGTQVETAKFYDGNTDAVVTNQGTLINVQGNDAVTHTTVASFGDATVGGNKTVTVTYTIDGDAALLANYNLDPATVTYTTNGYIIEPMEPNTDRPEDDTTVVEQGFDVYAYGYCSGSGYSIRYHLNSGNPDQYKLDFADSRFADVPWTNLATAGAEGTIDINVPVDLPMGDYSVTVTFRDSRFTWLESAPMTMTFHVNLPETFTMPLFNNVIALVDTCHCFSDIQWYHRANATDGWRAIPGATGYYYHATDSELQGEFFVKAKYNGVETYTCPQTDMETLITDDEQSVSVKAYPNPTTEGVTVTVLGSTQYEHTLRVISTVGVEKEYRTFTGNSTTIDMRDYQSGTYMVSVDGVVVRVIRN